jgi:NADH dehydrogenase
VTRSERALIINLAITQAAHGPGDGAALDVTRPGQLTAMTAQQAQRQGKAVARNKHRDLGFVVDLGGWQAVALSSAPQKSGI